MPKGAESSGRNRAAGGRGGDPGPRRRERGIGGTPLTNGWLILSLAAATWGLPTSLYGITVEYRLLNNSDLDPNIVGEHDSDY